MSERGFGPLAAVFWGLVDTNTASPLSFALFEGALRGIFCGMVRA
jgi:hypothetical protein